MSFLKRIRFTIFKNLKKKIGRKLHCFKVEKNPLFIKNLHLQI